MKENVPEALPSAGHYRLARGLHLAADYVVCDYPCAWCVPATLPCACSGSARMSARPLNYPTCCSFRPSACSGSANSCAGTGCSSPVRPRHARSGREYRSSSPAITAPRSQSVAWISLAGGLPGGSPGSDRGGRRFQRLYRHAGSATRPGMGCSRQAATLCASHAQAGSGAGSQ